MVFDSRFYRVFFDKIECTGTFIGLVLGKLLLLFLRLHIYHLILQNLSPSILLFLFLFLIYLKDNNNNKEIKLFKKSLCSGIQE